MDPVLWFEPPPVVGRAVPPRNLGEEDRCLGGLPLAEQHGIVAGRRPGRTRADEITVFDSSGTALQDVAAAVAVYEKARAAGRGVEVALDA